MADKIHRIHYTFRFDDGRKKAFDLRFSPEHFTLIRTASTPPPSWTELDHHQCPFCSLPATDHPSCPSALAIADIIQAFSNAMSYDTCVVQCTTAARTYHKRTAVMNGLASLLGLVMATSGCPATRFLRPMARFHLPFSTLEETLMRNVSIYLLSQYFRHKKGEAADLDLKILHGWYENLLKLNSQMLQRIQKVCDNDCDKNAIFSFHSMSALFSMEIDINLNALAYLFTPPPDPAQPAASTAPELYS